MKKHALFGWIILAVLVGSGSGEAQEADPTILASSCADPSCDGVCTFDWTPYYEKAVRLQDLQEETADHKTVRLEEFLKTDPRLQSMRETWYVRKDGLLSQTGALYRCLDSTIPDHRESAVSSEGSPAYSCFSGSTANILANPWLSAAAPSRTPAGGSPSGLVPLRRYLQSSGTDYRTWISVPPSGYTLNTIFSGSSTRLGYQRFGKLLDKEQVIGSGESSGYGVHFLENAFLRVDFNSTWGNAVGRITQVATGRQIVSEPIGDMMQSVVRFNAGDPDCRVPNPTQSGGAQCVSPDYSITTRWAGSPVLAASRVGTDPLAPQTLTSVVRPLDFCHNGKNRLTDEQGNVIGTTPPWPGTTDTDPLLWNGFIERSETLGCKLGTVVRKDVLRTVSRYQLANLHTGVETQAVVLNTHWLKPTDLVAGTPTTTEWDFKIYCKDLETGDIRQLLAAASGSGQTQVNATDDTCGALPDSTQDDPRHRHAVIASRTDGTFAYAVARLNISPGGFTTVSFRCAAGAGCNNPTKGTVIIQVNTTAHQLAKNQWSAPQESFLIVNSKGVILDNAINRLNELNTEAMAGGVSCLD